MKKRKGHLPGRYVGAHIRKHPKYSGEYVDVAAYQEKEEPLPAKFDAVPIQKELELKHPSKIMRKITGSNGTIACKFCGNDQFELPQDKMSDEVVQCKCGNAVGPYLSLLAFANGEGHTAVNAYLKPNKS